jgi:hypothetical protein
VGLYGHFYVVATLPLGNTILWFVTNRIYGGSFRNNPNIRAVSALGFHHDILMLWCRNYVPGCGWR